MKDGPGKSKEAEEGSRKEKGGHNGKKKIRGKSQTGRKEEWFLVTQRAPEGLMGTNSLWCNANSISGSTVMRCKWKQQRSYKPVSAESNLWFVIKPHRGR